MSKKQKLKIIPLGGLDEIGKNITVFEYGKDIIVVDCGLMFPDEEMPGIDIVIPDMSYLVKNSDRVRGVVLTHGRRPYRCIAVSFQRDRCACLRNKFFFRACGKQNERARIVG